MNEVYFYFVNKLFLVGLYWDFNRQIQPTQTGNHLHGYFQIFRRYDLNFNLCKLTFTLFNFTVIYFNPWCKGLKDRYMRTS